MATEITMPKLSDTMTEGRLNSWKKSIGEQVERGDIIAEVETDKANMELEAFASGILLETRVKAGELVQVGTIIGIIGEAGEASAAAPTPTAAVTVEPPVVESTAPVAQVGIGPERVMELPEDDQGLASAAPESPADQGKASPLVRKLAREHGVDLKVVPGSGPEGRILQDDLERFLAKQTTKGEGQPTTAAAPMAEVAATMPLSRMRAAIAKTVNESWRTTPHFSVTVEILMGAAEEIIRELKGGESGVSLNSLIIKGVALTLGKFPQLNNSFAGDRIAVNPGVNIGFAVSLEDGLHVPVIKGCERLSVKEISLQSRVLIDRARSGNISQEEISGGTFSISNLGMYGVEEFAAVIMPSQAAILAVGGVADRPVVVEGRVVAARTMRVTLSADHRLVDGAYAAQFLQELKRMLENPALMLV